MTETDGFYVSSVDHFTLELQPPNIAACRGKSSPALDLLSTRHTSPEINPGEVSEKLLAEVEFEFEQSHAVQSDQCVNNAPFIYFLDNTGKHRVVQGCCNNWQCPRCGQIRARAEYGRIVQGARQLADQGHDLFFVTVTCRGREMPLDQAMRDYYGWTSKLLNAMRMRASREGKFWAYAQITERQERGHPHSHIIATYCPPDAIETVMVRGDKQYTVLVSEWFTEQNERAGLGSQHVIRPVYNPVGVAAYLAKYFFKASMETEWPPGWRRVRYSRSWPKLPVESPAEGFPLLKMSDWLRMQSLGVTVYADSQITLDAAYVRLISCVVLAEDFAGVTPPGDYL